MSADFAFLVVDAFAVLAMALICIQYLCFLPKNLNAQLLGILCLAGISHVLLGRYQYGYRIAEPYQLALSPIFEPILNLLRNTAPGVFLLLSHTMLRDGKRLPKTLLVLFFVQLLMEEPIHFVIPPDFPAERLLTEVVPTLLQSVFVGWAIFWIVAEWPSDLIEARRGVRFLFLLFIGVNILLAGLLLRVVVPPSQIENYLVHMSLIGITTLLICVVLVRTLSSDGALLFQNAMPLAPEKVETAPQGEELTRTSAESARLRETLVRLLDVEHIYRRPQMSIRHLADELRLPEYRLRKLIHEELGFRNYNAFLHHYRLREAREMLSDPAQTRTPILTIALTVGYLSINTFNRAYREAFGETPSTFRARSLSGSEGSESPVER